LWRQVTGSMRRGDDDVLRALGAADAPMVALARSNASVRLGASSLCVR
jgi:hypothetical protein